MFFGLAEALSSQDVQKAEPERLALVAIGKNPGQVTYLSTEEGFFSPNGPIVIADGSLLFYPTTSRDKFIRYSANTISVIDLLPGWPSFYHGNRVFKIVLFILDSSDQISIIRLSCERACPASPLKPFVRWRQSTFSAFFFQIASK
jgi:hypothetical protein